MPLSLSSLSLHGLTDFEMMIRSRSALYPTLPPDANAGAAAAVQEIDWAKVHSNLPGQCTHLINLDQLQEDVILSHIMAKPLIKPPSTLRMTFSFRDSNRQTKEKWVTL